MANRNQRKTPEQLADPHVLLGVAERKERRLSVEERVEVMAMLRMEGQAFTQRDMAELFGVSHVQIGKDLAKVDDRLADHFRKRGRNWEGLVAKYGYQHARALRSLWQEYEDAAKDGEGLQDGQGAVVKNPAFVARVRAEIASRAFQVSDSYLNRMQELGIAPRAPRRVQVGAVLVSLPQAADVARAIMEGAERAGMTETQREVFKREVVKALNAQAHKDLLLQAMNEPA